MLPLRLPLLPALSVLALSCASAAPCPVPPTPPPVAPGVAACAVWDREVDFARSVHDHDAHAFAEHVHPGATFVSGDSYLRGPAAITEAWKGYIVGDKSRMAWHPTSVVLTGDGHVAISRGPFWLESLKPGASPRFLTGVFQSIWALDADGVWRVTVDGGGPDPVPATEADVAKIKASIPAQCPMRG